LLGGCPPKEKGKKGGKESRCQFSSRLRGRGTRRVVRDKFTNLSIREKGRENKMMY